MRICSKQQNKIPVQGAYVKTAFGKVTDTMFYEPYGKVVSRTGETYTPFMYVGEFGVETDDSGLYYMRARYYNPVIKRFVNIDPIRDGYNWYGYVGGNPINSIDPFGTYNSFNHYKLNEYFIRDYIAEQFNGLGYAIKTFPDRVETKAKSIYRETSNWFMDTFIPYDDPADYTSEGKWNAVTPITLLNNDLTNDNGWYGISGPQMNVGTNYEFGKINKMNPAELGASLISAHAKLLEANSNTEQYSANMDILGANADVGVNRKVVGLDVGGYLYSSSYERKIDIFDTGLILVMGGELKVGLGVNVNLAKGEYGAAVGPGGSIIVGLKRRNDFYGFESEEDRHN